MTFSERVAGKRDALGLTQQQLADLVGVSHQTIFKWETGETRPRRAKLEALAAALEMDLDELLGWWVELGETSAEYLSGVTGVVRATPDVEAFDDAVLEVAGVAGSCGLKAVRPRRDDGVPSGATGRGGDLALLDGDDVAAVVLVDVLHHHGVNERDPTVHTGPWLAFAVGVTQQHGPGTVAIVRVTSYDTTALEGAVPAVSAWADELAPHGVTVAVTAEQLRWAIQAAANR